MHPIARTMMEQLGASGVVEARYWAIFTLSTKSPSDGVLIAEAEMRGEFGGADLTGSGTASASSEFSGSVPPSKAFDGAQEAITDCWVSSPSDPNGPKSARLIYDFGEDVSIVEASIGTYRSSQNNMNRAPQAWRLEYSDDGTAWTTLFSHIDTSDWTEVENRVVNTSTANGG